VLEAATRTIVSPFVLVGGIRVASVDDIMATKLAVVAKRGELRDYFDIMKIEQDRLIMAETGLAFVVEKFSPVQSDQYILSIVKALGYLDDVEDDSALPVSRKVVVDYWMKRQRSLMKHVAMFGA
jgi:predicted nucleotidyltransferase component of viral defense system